MGLEMKQSSYNNWKIIRNQKLDVKTGLILMKSRLKHIYAHKKSNKKLFTTQDWLNK